MSLLDNACFYNYKLNIYQSILAWTSDMDRRTEDESYFPLAENELRQTVVLTRTQLS